MGLLYKKALIIVKPARVFNSIIIIIIIIDNTVLVL
jgi:hypothetical protein